nr:MAG TPA: hypothetical protein [Caudoviricetes sp.]
MLLNSWYNRPSSGYLQLLSGPTRILQHLYDTVTDMCKVDEYI